ncbi:MAG: HAD family hydrolase [Patescibacteria group bacterium]|nr:HAD family hydrolase [Patescibacteria group bacterium]
MIRACLFDLGNTLIEYPTPAQLRDNYLATAGHMAGALDPKLLDRMQEILSAERKFGMETHDEATIKNALVNAARLERLTFTDAEIMRMISEIYYYGFGKFTRPVEGAHELLCFLHARGIRMGIVSNTPFPGSLFRSEMERYLLAGFFRTFVWSSEFGKRKPCPDIFKQAIDDLKVCPSEAIFVGDKIDRDVMGALGAGMSAIWLDREGKSVHLARFPHNDPHAYRVLSLKQIMSLKVFQ